jgi:hypothetical protein
MPNVYHVSSPSASLFSSTQQAGWYSTGIFYKNKIIGYGGFYPLTQNGIYVIYNSEVINMGNNILKIEDEFEEIDTRTVDDRNRLTLGELLKGSKRVRLYKNDRGEFLLQPVVEIPASEAWLFQNKEAFESVKKGLKDASKGKISKLNLKDL